MLGKLYSQWWVVSRTGGSFRKTRARLPIGLLICTSTERHEGAACLSGRDRGGWVWMRMWIGMVWRWR